MPLELKSIIYIVMINNIIIKYRILLSLAVFLLTSFSDPKLLDFHIWQNLFLKIVSIPSTGISVSFHLWSYAVNFLIFFQFRQCEHFPTVYDSLCVCHSFAFLKFVISELSVFGFFRLILVSGSVIHFGKLSYTFIFKYFLLSLLFLILLKSSMIVHSFINFLNFLDIIFFLTPKCLNFTEFPLGKILLLCVTSDSTDVHCRFLGCAHYWWIHPNIIYFCYNA